MIRGTVQIMRGCGRIVIAGVGCFIAATAAAQGPAVSNVAVSLADGVATVTYDLANGPADVRLEFSDDGGATYPFDTPGASGDAGLVAAGTDNTILWDVDAAFPGACIAEARFRVLADEVALVPLVSVPAGSFEMGDPFNERVSDEVPVHTVTLSSYSIGEFEVTNAQVASVFNWAIGQALIDTVSASAVTHSGEDLLILGGSFRQLSLSGGELVVATRDGLSMADHYGGVVHGDVRRHGRRGQCGCAGDPDGGCRRGQLRPERVRESVGQ